MSMYQKFNPHSDATIEQVKESKASKIREKINNHEELDSDEKEFITNKVNNNGFFKTKIPVLGWAINFSDVLKRFWVKFAGYYIEEYYATSEEELVNLLNEKEIVEYYEIKSND